MRYDRRPRRHLPGLAALLALAVTAPLALTSAGSAATAAPADPGGEGIVVRLSSLSPEAIDALMADFPVKDPVPMLASRGIHLVQPSDESVSMDPKKVKELVKELEKSSQVNYAEPNYDTALSDRRLHSWLASTRVDSGPDPQPWQDQELTRFLGLSEAHQLTTGAGTVVAVLDSGVDTTHPALIGHLVAGYDYVDDDDDPTDHPQGLDSNSNGITDEAYGHGTFVAGVVSLVAPGARVMPMRVLDSDGSGNVFALATAVAEAVDAGADVINLSLGTGVKTKSHLLSDVIKDAQHRGVIVVAAAGNGATDDRQYPAQEDGVLSVASSTSDGLLLSAFSNWGDWVDVATPAGHILGPVPGGEYAWWAGTSMAAPQVSGQLALIASLAADEDSKTRIGAITKTARKMSTKQVKNGSIDLLASLERARE